MSIEAPWGAGKTSLMNLIRENLKALSEDKAPVLVDFNPWVIGARDALIQAFLAQLSLAVGQTDHVKGAKKAAKELTNYSSAFDLLKFVPGAEPWASIVKGVLQASGKALDDAAELKLADLEKRREAVVKALRTFNRPVVVFIDDIDRIPPQEVFEVIRLVKAVADFPRVTYILGFDAKYVDDALQSAGIPKSARYLDKIIQVRLNVPKASVTDIRAMVNVDLERFPSATESVFQGHSERLSEIYHGALRFLLETPRDVKRVSNRLLFIEPSMRREVAFCDMLGLETIAIKAPAVYGHIRNRPQAYTGNQPDEIILMKSDEKVVSDYAQERRDALDTVDSELRPAVARLLKLLFPLVEPKGFEDTATSSYETSGRVASANRLRIALNFGLPPEEHSLDEARDFLRQPRVREDTLRRMLAGSAFGRFIEQLGLLLDVEDAQDAAGLVLALAKSMDSPEAAKLDDGDVDILMLSMREQVWRVCESVLRKLDIRTRESALLALVDARDGLAMGASAMRRCAIDLALPSTGTKSPPATDPICSSKFWASLSARWISTVTNAAKDGRLFGNIGRALVLRMVQVIDKKTAKKVFQAVKGDSAKLQGFALALVEGARDSRKGKSATFDEEFVTTFATLPTLRQALRTLSAKVKVEGDAAVAFAVLSDGQPRYFVDGSVKSWR